MSNNPILSKPSKGMQVGSKPSASSSQTTGIKPMVNPLPASQQTKVVTRLITFFETK